MRECLLENSLTSLGYSTKIMLKIPISIGTEISFRGHSYIIGTISGMLKRLKTHILAYSIMNLTIYLHFHINIFQL